MEVSSVQQLCEHVSIDLSTKFKQFFFWIANFCSFCCLILILLLVFTFYVTLFQLISSAIQRCRIADHLCRLSVLLKSSPSFEPPLVRISGNNLTLSLSLYIYFCTSELLAYVSYVLCFVHMPWIHITLTWIYLHDFL